MAGAIYGVTRIPNEAKELIMKWDNEGEIALRAYKLFYKKLKWAEARIEIELNINRQNLYFKF